nr:Dihydrofolate reductase [uncultured bacterium]
MKTPELCMIAAIDEARGLGRDNSLLWRIPEDMKHLQELTVPHSVIMGRKTFDSLHPKFRPLPRRHNFVITRNPNFSYERTNITHSLDEALKLAMEFEDTRIAIIGGGEIYNQALPYVNSLYLTLVQGTYDVDTYFPEYSQQFPHIVEESDWMESKEHWYKFVTLDRG